MSCPGSLCPGSSLWANSPGNLHVPWCTAVRGSFEVASSLLFEVETAVHSSPELVCPDSVPPGAEQGTAAAVLTKTFWLGLETFYSSIPSPPPKSHLSYHIYSKNFLSGSFLASLIWTLVFPFFISQFQLTNRTKQAWLPPPPLAMSSRLCLLQGRSKKRPKCSKNGSWENLKETAKVDRYWSGSSVLSAAAGQRSNKKQEEKAIILSRWERLHGEADSKVSILFILCLDSVDCTKVLVCDWGS